MRTQLQSCIVSNLLLYIKRQVKFSRNLPWRLLIPRLKNLITENAWRLCNGHDFCLISGDQSHRASRSYCWEGSVLSWRRCCFKNKTADQPDWRYVAYVSFCLLHICGNRRISSLITDFFFLVPFFFSENNDWEEKMNSHMFFTVHIYQYRVDKNSKNAGGGKNIYDTHSRPNFAIYCKWSSWQASTSFNTDTLSLLRSFTFLLNQCFVFSHQSTEAVLGYIWSISLAARGTLGQRKMEEPAACPCLDSETW